MRITVAPRAGLHGNILLVTLFVTGVAGLVLVSYLTMVNQQSKVTARSQSWNSCLAVAEAGVEEALAHLNQNGLKNPNMTQSDWKLLRDGVYYVKRYFDNGNYEVSIQMGSRPVITAVGRIPAPLSWTVTKTNSDGSAKKAEQAFLSRTIKVQCRAVGRFTKAIVARDKIELNGKYVKVDSFHSYDTNASAMTTNGYGVYDPAKRRDRGDVAVIEGMSDTLSISDAHVWGKVSTGPDGNLKTNKNIVVGSTAFHDAGKKGVEDGWATDDANFDMPSVTLPYSGGITPSGGWVGTNY